MSGPLSAISIAVVASLVAAAIHDVATRTIPNRIALVIASMGLAGHALSGTIAAGLLAGGFVFGALAFVWSRGWIGGGDVKLAGSAAVAIHEGQVASFILATTLAGGVLALLYLALARVVPQPTPGPRVGLLARCMKAEAWRIRRGGPLPYAVAIAVGGLYVVHRSLIAG